MQENEKEKHKKKGNQIRQNKNDDAAIPLQRTTGKTCCAQLM